MSAWWRTHWAASCWSKRWFPSIAFPFTKQIWVITKSPKLVIRLPARLCSWQELRLYA